VNDNPTVCPHRPVTYPGRCRRRFSIRHLRLHCTPAPRHRADTTRACEQSAHPVHHRKAPCAGTQPRDDVAPHGRGFLRRVLLRILGVALVCALVSLLACGPAAAAALNRAPLTVGPMLAVDDLKTVMNRATAWLVAMLATVATFFLTLGGAKYLGAGGDPSEVERAKSSLRNAGIGYALAVLAPVFLRILQGILGVK